MNITPFQMSYIFETSDVYDVPSYQRDYKWDKKEVRIMMQDLCDFAEELKISTKDKSYYFGNIITQKTPSGTTESEKANYYLIDGQQRLTTFYLLYKVILTIQHEFDVKNNKENLQSLNTIFNSYFKNKNGDKFKLLNKNNSLYNFIYNTGRLNEENKNLSENYEIISTQLKSKILNEEDLSLWNRVIKNIMLGKLELTEEQNAELIFENINSKGKILSLSELIKNKFFLKNNLLKKSLILKSDSQEEQNLIEEFNNQMETDIINIFEIVNADQNNLDLKLDASDVGKLNIKSDDYLRAITSFVFEFEIKSEDHLAFMDIRQKIDSIKTKEDFEKIISRFKEAVWFIHILNSFMSKQDEGSIYVKWLVGKSPAFIIIALHEIEKMFKNSLFTKENIASIQEITVVNIFKNVFKIIARASIYSEGFLGINLWRSIPSSIVSDENEVIDIEKTILKLVKISIAETEIKEGSEVTIEESEEIANEIVFNKEEFIQKISNFDFYKRDRLLSKYLLMLVEHNLETESRSLEIKTWNNINEILDSSSWTIEHIIPQKINPSTTEGRAWLDDLGTFDYMSQMDKIGNLSIASLRMNTAMKNYQFAVKKSKFTESRLIMNNMFDDWDKFGNEEYKLRSEFISGKIFEILN